MAGYSKGHTPTNKRWTTTHDDELIRRHAAGESLHSIAPAMGFAKDTIYKHAKRLNLAWDRSTSVAASEARRAIAAEKRAQLELDYLDDAQRFRQQNLEPYVYQFTSGSVTADLPHPADQLKLQQASVASLRTALQIAEHDEGANVEQAKSLLGDLATALGIALKAEAPAGDDDAAT